MRLRTSLAALALALIANASGALADATPEQIVAALSGVEHGPSTTEVRAWSERSIPTLVSLAEDPQRPEFVRARAAAAIRTFAPAPEARAALERLANGPAPHPLVLRAALDSLCIAWAELAIAQRFLGSLSSDHREAAAWAIARSARPEARAILARARASERDPAIRATIDSAERELERAITANRATPATAQSAVLRAPTAAMSAPRTAVSIPPSRSPRRARAR
jgi:hypothetical protein